MLGNYLYLSTTVTLRVEASSAYLLDRKSQTFRHFNVSAAVILSYFTQPREESAIRAALDCVPLEKKDNVVDFIAAMKRDGVLSYCDPDQPVSIGKVVYLGASADMGDVPALPLGIEAELTMKCSRNCVYCAYESHPKANSIHELNVSEWKALLKEFSNSGGFFVRFTGGDPLLKDGFCEIVRAADNLGLIITIGSDLTVLKDEILDEISSLANLYAVQTTLDGSTLESADCFRGNGNFKSTTSNIRRLRSKNIPVLLGTVINKRNFREIPDIVRLARDLNVQGYCVGPLYIAGRAGQNKLEDHVLNDDELREAADLFGDAIRESGVAPADPAWLGLEAAGPVPTSRVWNNQVNLMRSPDHLIRIDPIGNLYPSIKLRHVLGSGSILGNVRSSSIASIWTGSKTLSTLRKSSFAHEYFGKVIDTQQLVHENT